jgi:hypothetical protein
MSNEFAVGAVTLTLRNLLDHVKELRDSDVIDDLPVDVKPTAEILITNLPLDEAYEFDQGKNQVNLFLYHVEHSAAWRNREIPGRIKNGESGNPPLGLNLYYLITAYGQDKNEIIGHLLLGKAMSIFHDHPLLGRDEIRTALGASDLHEQIERVRITPQPISIDEVSKLWTGFQSQYKLSVAYQVAVVLIESKRPSRTPLPVLMRGEGDRGVLVQPFVDPPYPRIETISFPNKQNAAQPGDILTIAGIRLKGDSITTRFRNYRLTAPLEVAAEAGATDAEVKVKLPNDPNNWPAGVYTASIVVHKAGEEDKTSNELPFMLATVVNFPITIAPLSPPGGNNYLATVTFNPAVRPEQDAYLLLGSSEFKADEHSTATNSLSFHLNNVEDGSYFIRLRIDGSDSLLIDTTVSPPVFKASNKVVLP